MDGIRGSQWQMRRFRWRANTPMRVWVVLGSMVLAVIAGLFLVATLT